MTLRYAINDKKGEEKMPDKRTTRIEAAKIIEEKAPRLVKKMLEGKVKTHNNQGIKQPKEK